MGSGETIGSGSIPANNLGLGPALSPSLDNVFRGAVNQANAQQRAIDQGINRALSTGGVFDNSFISEPLNLPRLSGVSAPPNYVTPQTEIQRLIASNAQRGIHVVEDYSLGGVSYSDTLVRNEFAAYKRDLMATTDPAEAFIGTLLLPLTHASAYIMGGAVDVVAPRSEPSRHVVFSDGTSATGLSGGPSSGAMWGQGLAIVTAAKLPGMRTSGTPAPQITGIAPAPAAATQTPSGYWWSGRYSTAASQPGAYQNSGGLVFPTRRNSGLSGNALSGAQEAFAKTRLLEDKMIEQVRGQAREAGLTVLESNARIACKQAENAVQRAVNWYNSRIK